MKNKDVVVSMTVTEESHKNMPAKARGIFLGRGGRVRADQRSGGLD